ncbi:MAG: FliI/YscN family ATPase [Planctomycetota bacterium]
MSVLARELALVSAVEPMRISGRIVELRGLTVLARELPVPVGGLVMIEASAIGEAIPAEVVGFSQDDTILMPLGQTAGMRRGDRVVGIEHEQTALVGPAMLGRCVNGLGEPIDSLGAMHDLVRTPLSPAPVPALTRPPIKQPLATGVRALDLFTTLGRGQRLGIFAGPGVGKSTLMGQIARHTEADVNVIALIGERGREAREFIDDALGPEGLQRSIVVIATGDESPVMRLRAAKLACAAAEHFRSLGKAVMLMMDSVTRFAHAQRQVGLSVGEPPATRGYTPSVFAQLALMLERAGTVDASLGGGSITGLYTVLVEGDEEMDPVADAARGILDGHISLSRALAQRGHFPAIDVLGSVSRVASAVSTPEHQAGRRELIKLLAAHKDVEELLQVGAYARGSRAEADIAIDHKDQIDALLRQSPTDGAEMDASVRAMLSLAVKTGNELAKRQAGNQAAGA